MASLWTNSAGKIIEDGGSIVECADCPCDLAPSSCPCAGTWPPASWPCGGLLETYSLTAFDLKRAPTAWYRLKSALTLTAHPSNSCVWQTTGIVEFSGDGGGTWSDQTHDFDVSLNETGVWRFRFPLVVASVDKSTGQTPVGLYAENVNVLGFPDATMSATIS